jgi:hypothetical protein
LRDLGEGRSPIVHFPLTPPHPQPSQRELARRGPASAFALRAMADKSGEKELSFIAVAIEPSLIML